MRLVAISFLSQANGRSLRQKVKLERESLISKLCHMLTHSPSLSENGRALASAFSMYLAEHGSIPLLGSLELRVFGSIARGSSSPTDFDVVIVYGVREYSAARRLRAWMRQNSDRIRAALGLQLNLLVLSEGEFFEAKNKIGPTVLIPISDK